MDVLAIIPARAGSKSIPRKNIRDIAGKPLLAWTVAAALESRKVTRVVVSTDGADIARAAREAGAEVVERPAELATDTASSESALLHVLNTLAARENYHPDLVVFLQCTSPLTTGSEIDQTVNQLLANNADSAFSAVPFYYFVWENTPEGAVGINHLASIRQRRQERPPQFLESGAIYVMRTTGFLRHNHRFFGKTLAVEFPVSHLQEIDDPADWRIAEARLLERLKRQGRFKLPVRPEAVIFDFDGVFTDNLVSIDSSGNETVRCSRADGFGIRLLREAGFSLAVISTEIDPVVSRRCEKLGIECLQGIHDKKAVLLEFAAARQFSPERLIFVGNDLNDLPAFEVAGCRAAPADAHPEILRQADIILTRSGGHGAIRELAELLLSTP
ncbi:cytidylyltransferase domain-containing protein [Victivallis vadensis]|uniref:cytidylyltransferase domain-containing protein n=1 Tax=Victivallis vadensis TaxID=172901 RepID=UPI003D01571C